MTIMLIPQAASIQAHFLHASAIARVESRGGGTTGDGHRVRLNPDKSLLWESADSIQGDRMSNQKTTVIVPARNPMRAGAFRGGRHDRAILPTWCFV